MISVIDMPPPEESIWWRGKRGFEVGFFPCECVEVIGDKVPNNLNLPHHAHTLPHLATRILRVLKYLLTQFNSEDCSSPDTH